MNIFEYYCEYLTDGKSPVDCAAACHYLNQRYNSYRIIWRHRVVTSGLLSREVVEEYDSFSTGKKVSPPSHTREISDYFQTRKG